MPAAKRKDPLAGWIDQLGDVQQKLAPHRAAIALEKDLKDKIRRRYDDADATASFDTEGERYRAHVGARGFKRQITNMGRVFQALRKARFLKYCGMTLEALERACEEGGCHEVVTAVLIQDQTGPRSLDVFAKEAKS